MYTTNPKAIQKGMIVDILIEKTTDKEKRGVVAKILTNKVSDKGVKVQLKSGERGRIVYIPSKHEVERERKKQLHTLLYEKQKLYAIWLNKGQTFLHTNQQGHVITFLFTEEKEAAAFAKAYLPNELAYTVRLLSRDRSITTCFKQIQPTFYIVNNAYRIDHQSLVEEEAHFKRLLKQTHKGKHD